MPSKKKQKAEQQQIANDGSAIAQETREVWLPIVGDELAKQGHELAKVTQRINDLRDDKRNTNTEYTVKIKQLVEQQKKLAQIVETATAPQKIDVEVHYDYAHAELIVKRIDNGVEIERRTMTAEELAVDPARDTPPESAALAQAQGSLEPPPPAGD